jgi:hypothetical protein
VIRRVSGQPEASHKILLECEIGYAALRDGCKTSAVDWEGGEGSESERAQKFARLSVDVADTQQEIASSMTSAAQQQAALGVCHASLATYITHLGEFHPKVATAVSGKRFVFGI